MITTKLNSEIYNEFKSIIPQLTEEECPLWKIIYIRNNDSRKSQDYTNIFKVSEKNKILRSY